MADGDPAFWRVIHSAAITDVKDPRDYEFVGTVMADEVTAALPPAAGTTLCGGVPVSFSAEERVSGRFSADDATRSPERRATLTDSRQESASHRSAWRAERQ